MEINKNSNGLKEIILQHKYGYKMGKRYLSDFSMDTSKPKGEK
jgi:hypothetical protein